MYFLTTWVRSQPYSYDDHWLMSTTLRFCMHIVKIFAFKKNFSRYTTELHSDFECLSRKYSFSKKDHYSTTHCFCMHIVKIFAFKKDFSLSYSTTLWFGMGVPKMFIWLENTLQHYTVILHTYPENKSLQEEFFSVHYSTKLWFWMPLSKIFI